VIAWVRERMRLRRRRQIRRMMRGFRRLRTDGRLAEIVEIKDRLARTACVPASVRSSWMCGAARDVHRQVVQQYLATHVLHERLQHALLRAAGTRAPLVCPLPAVWRRELRAMGVPVDDVRSATLWWLLLGAWLGRGGMRLLGVVRVLVVGPGPTLRACEGAAGFDGLGIAQLPRPDSTGGRHDIFSWYLAWEGRAPAVRRLVHTVTTGATVRLDGVPVEPVPSLVPGLDRHGALRTLVWTVAAFVRSVAGLCVGRWWHAVLLSQAVQARQVVDAPGSPAVDYLFHNSGWLYRPLWTYEAEARGSRILFYFYSTNIETFKAASGYRRQAHMWHVATWPLYLVWDEAQADFVRREVAPDAQIRVVGSIGFSGNSAPMPPIPTRAVAVFDVQPYRNFIYQVVIGQQVYYTPEVALAFLEDIRAVLGEQGRPMVFKHKRNLGGHAMHGRYRRRLAELQVDPGVIAIDPEVPASRVIEDCEAVISMPFTSTALQGRAHGKPSVFYAPTVGAADPVQTDDRAAHGIPVVRGPEQLRDWLASLPNATVRS